MDAADGGLEEADGCGGRDELEDGSLHGAAFSQADELQSEDGRSDRVRLGSAARR